ncbi:hypothetical protein Dsin_016777 [Dipteronia sinensis]|uniref:Reverse transcriptase zinc-binding domain-containing protein n=1 Tax=Dipteronia sinensis TaxID=43782 RepID=A0AAE0AEC8_9ROSI|nr:hypothetical protein Dsin_016777 [Dipteronia sinensis]
MVAKCNSTASFVWRSLVWGKDMLMAGTCWRVGNGESICIYADKCVPRPFTFKVISPPKLDLNAKVSQLITPTGGWDMHVLRENFVSSDVNDIIQIPLGKGDRKDDIIWHFDVKGTYAVKSGYWIGYNTASDPSQSTPHPLTSWWTFLWKLWIPLKVKIFIWKA